VYYRIFRKDHEKFQSLVAYLDTSNSKMSNYENYNATSQFYDVGRIPSGSDIYCSLFQGYLKRPLAEVHLLDVGCGTGNYSKAFLDAGIGKVTAIDGSTGMLAKAEEKLKPYIMEKKVTELKICRLPDIPFPDSSFDVVSIIQVLHHLDKPYDGFPNAKKVITEAFRVLKPGGVFLIDHCSHEQLRYGAWYANLLPRAVEKNCDLLMPIGEMLSFAEEKGFLNASRVVSPWETILVPEVYLNKDGPFKEEWRSMDSLWKLADIEGEVDAALKSLTEKKEFGMLDEWFEQVEKKRKEVGAKTGILLQKPLNC